MKSGKKIMVLVGCILLVAILASVVALGELSAIYNTYKTVVYRWGKSKLFEVGQLLICHMNCHGLMG